MKITAEQQDSIALNKIYWLAHYGHFDNPTKPNSKNVTSKDLNKLTLKDGVVKEAIQSLQEIDANLDSLSQFNHGRSAILDGEIGPATVQLMSLPRCACPDYSRENAGNNSSWPKPGCDPKDPDRREQSGVRFFIDETKAPTKVKSYLEKSIIAAQYCTAEMGCWTRRVDDIQEAELATWWEYLRGSIIGWNTVPSNPQCNMRVTGRLDIGYTPSDWRYFCTLLVHEVLMHGFGFGHTRGGIGNPSIMLANWTTTEGIHHPTWVDDPHESTYKAAFGGVWADITPDPPIDWHTVHQYKIGLLEHRIQIRNLSSPQRDEETHKF